MENEEYIELKSERWQRVFMLCPFGFIGVLILDSVLLRPFLPERFIFIQAKDPDLLSTHFSAALIFIMCFLMWWHTENYYLRADDTGLLQRTGLRINYVRWEDVFSYCWEINFWGSMKPRLVFRDAEGRVIFRASESLVKWSSQGMKAEKRFWEFVEGQLAYARGGSAR
jgi:hypothetical protein